MSHNLENAWIEFSFPCGEVPFMRPIWMLYRELTKPEQVTKALEKIENAGILDPDSKEQIRMREIPFCLIFISWGEDFPFEELTREIMEYAIWVMGENFRYDLPNAKIVSEGGDDMPLFYLPASRDFLQAMGFGSPPDFHSRN